MSASPPSIDLRPDHWDIVRETLQRHVPDRSVLAFGSRATWTAWDYSDLDIAIMGEVPLPQSTLWNLKEEFVESELPFRVDIVEFARLEDDFRGIVRAHGVLIQSPKDTVSPIIDIPEKEFRTIQKLLQKHLPDTEVWAYGDRVNGSATPKSDLYLAVFSTPKQQQQVDELGKSLEESDLLFRVCISVWDDLSGEIRQKIPADHVRLGNGMIPHRIWPRIRLDECIVMNKETYSQCEEWPFVNYLDTGSITDNWIEAFQRFDTGNGKLPSRARRKVQTGDIVFSTVRPNQRHFGLLRDIPENVLASTGFAVFHAREDIADTGFLYWFLAQDQIVERLQTIAEHSTSAYPAIRPTDICELEIDLPPLPEQRAIAHILGTLDDKIQLNRQMNQTLEAIARTIFKDWFVDFGPVRAKMEGRDSYLPPEIWELFPDMLDDEGKPAGWMVSEIGSEVDVFGGGTPSTKDHSYWDGGTHNWATPKDLSKLTSPVLLDTDRKITDAGLNKISSGLLPAGTVLLSSRAPIGYLAIAEDPTAVNQGFIAMVCNKQLPNIFVLFWCHQNIEYIKAVSSGSTFAEINKRSFCPIPVTVPSSKILTAYYGLVRPLYACIVVNTKANEMLSRIRNTLLPKLISGEIRLTEVENILQNPGVNPPSLLQESLPVTSATEPK